MIKLDHITQTYKTPEGREFKALDDVSIEIRPGEIFGIIGRSGAGKSTLVRCINLLNRPSEGTVTVDGKNLTELSEDELRESRRSIGMIFQHFNLLSSRTVYDNVALPLELVGTPKNVIREKVEPLLKLDMGSAADGLLWLRGCLRFVFHCFGQSADAIVSGRYVADFSPDSDPCAAAEAA